jgi:hypothetical protein
MKTLHESLGLAWTFADAIKDPVEGGIADSLA